MRSLTQNICTYNISSHNCHYVLLTIMIVLIYTRYIVSSSIPFYIDFNGNPSPKVKWNPDMIACVVHIYMHVLVVPLHFWPYSDDPVKATFFSRSITFNSLHKTRRWKNNVFITTGYDIRTVIATIAFSWIPLVWKNVSDNVLPRCNDASSSPKVVSTVVRIPVWFRNNLGAQSIFYSFHLYTYTCGSTIFILREYYNTPVVCVKHIIL